MSRSADPPGPLEQVHELNRLFLKSLQGRDDEHLYQCGFPAGAIGTLRAAEAAQLDAVAVFPRALFDLSLEPPDQPARLPDDLESGAERILDLTIVFSAWSISRDSLYHARLFLGLSPRLIHSLRTTRLSQLPCLALTRAKIRCAFAGAEWLWRELLAETRPEARRQLVLVALQPPAEGRSPFPGAAHGTPPKLS